MRAKTAGSDETAKARAAGSGGAGIAEAEAGTGGGSLAGAAAGGGSLAGVTGSGGTAIAAAAGTGTAMPASKAAAKTQAFLDAIGTYPDASGREVWSATGAGLPCPLADLCPSRGTCLRASAKGGRAKGASKASKA